MTRNGWGLGLMLVVTLGWACLALGLYEEFFPPSADGNFNTYGTTDDPDPTKVEGYAINGDGRCRISSRDQHFLYMGFDIEGDGPNGVPTRDEIRLGEPIDGQLLLDWLVDKKPVSATLYLHDDTNGSCSSAYPPGTTIGEPQVLLAFRCGNTGRFNDRSVDGNGFTGCCGYWNKARLEGGENAPPAWRMGRPVGPSPLDPTRYTYEQQGDIGTPDPSVGLVPEFWKISTLDSVNPGAEVHAGQAFFDSDGDGHEGWSGNRDMGESNAQDGMWAMEYLVRHSDAHLVNSEQFDAADCTDTSMGVPDARMLDGLTDPYGENTSDPFDDDWIGGWFAVAVDRPLVKAVAVGGETKGLVFSAINATANPTQVPKVATRDQSPRDWELYLYVVATIAGDVSNDGCVDVFDVIDTVNAFGSRPGDPNWNEEADFDVNGSVDVFDVIAVVNNFGNCVP